MTKNVSFVSGGVSIRDLTSYDQIFKVFGHIFNRNKVGPKPKEEPQVVYSSLTSIIGDSLPRIDPDYARMKRENGGFRSLSKALLTRAEREIKEMDKRAYG
jgi:hypothetical protein